MSIWKSQYEQPNVDSLVGQIDPAIGEHYLSLRRRVIDMLPAKPRLEWMGITWHWCETIKPDDGGSLLALRLIPDPQLPRIAATISRDFFINNPPDTLPKPLRGGLAEATCIGQQVWCEWAVGSADITDNICAFIEKTRPS